jgi:F-type H+-transporting ATPase subunit alpha
MIAYNEGLLDALEPKELTGRLRVLEEQVKGQLLPLDAGRDEWLKKLRSWLGPMT